MPSLAHSLTGEQIKSIKKYFGFDLEAQIVFKNTLFYFFHFSIFLKYIRHIGCLD